MRLFEIENRLPEKVAKAFSSVADEQRGSPEHAMLKVQRAYGGGVLSPVVEHVGDILHRMTEHAEYGEYLEGIVREKVERGLRYLLRDYSFEREMKENIKSNGVDVDKLNMLLSAYAREHRRLPVYNAAHFAAREAAVAIGEQNWGKAIRNLEHLKTMLDNGTYQTTVSSYKLDAQGNPIPYAP